MFRGIHDSVGVDRPGGWRFGTTFGQTGTLIKHIASLGDGKKSDRLSFTIKNNRDAADHRGLITAVKEVGRPAGPAFDAAASAALDLDQWLRAYAASSTCARKTTGCPSASGTRTLP